MDNDQLTKGALESENLSVLHVVLTYETVTSFMKRDMDKALKCTHLALEYFPPAKKFRAKYTEIYNMFYEALVCYHFKRQTGEEEYQLRADDALAKMREWARHSDWNFR